MAESCVIGVDLGGTNVRAAAYAADGRVVGKRAEAESRAQSGTAAIVDAVVSTVQAVQASLDNPAAAVGIAVPGHIDDASGLVRWAPNFGETREGVFEYWVDVPLKAAMQERLRLPVVMGNDANCAALGEYAFGSGEGKATCLVLLTIGTGIGGGVVLSPAAVDGYARGPLLLLGGNKGGAELGHTTVAHGGLDCNAGTYGALEAYCQRDSIVRRAQHKLKRGRESRVTELAGGDIAQVTPKHLADAAEAGDELAIEVWREVGTYLGSSIGSFINIFAPEVVAVGGQISKAGRWLLEPAIAEARNVAIPSLFADTRILQAVQTDDAGILGAAALARQSVQTSMV
ncbi:MAG: ROK family protein [Armatimonadetes bacterium]|nr:ROK family protein [Armatimonadota bacterium]